jgi:hypothetical protein
MRVGVALSVCLVVLASSLGAQRPEKAVPVSPQELARIWDTEHVSPPLPPLITHEDVQRRLTALAEADPNRFIVERVGASLEGRAINMITVGTGALRVLLWSQMHGDEPTATAALFDVLSYIQHHRDDPALQRLLAQATLYIAARSLQSARRLQPAQPVVGDDRRRSPQACVDLPVGRGL